MNSNRDPLIKCRLLVLVVLTASYLTGCSQIPREAINPETLFAQDSVAFGVRPEIPTPEQLLHLEDRQKQEILNFINHPDYQDLPSDTKILRYLTQVTYNFHYQADTYTVPEAINKREGNCLTLAMVTTAIADLMGVEIEYELVNSPPVFEREQDVVSRGIHVRSHVLRPEAEIKQFFIAKRGTIIDYFPSRDAHFVGNLTESEMLSSYYNNIAVVLLEKNQLDTAYWYSREALNYAPYYAPNINTLAVIYRRHGNWQHAETIYQWAIARVDKPLTLLKNYRALLEHQGRYDEAERLLKKISQLKDTNPYSWLDLGDEAFQQGDYQQAKRFYKKSIKLDPYLQFGYEGLAKTWFQLGKPKKAKKMWIKAQDNSLDDEMKRFYQNKIDQLNNTIDQ